MTVKCKMCGGVVNAPDDASVFDCDYCGTRQTLPKVNDEKRASLFERANAYRVACEFDKAALIYENILSEAPDEAEAYWGTVLCRYGIEYVEDPRSHKRVPTCHRTQFKSILEDVDYLAAIKNADILAREVYKAEAEYIDKVQKGILAISAKEEPFDIFICYKETDERGERTIDSVIAQDIYDALNSRGYKVFFSRITLEDKLGSAYEPYIFAALNSAKIMLVCGTDPSHFDAVWVKNEWSRYLALIEGGAKKTVIPCYRDITAYDLPREFVALQGQDMGKVGAIQDLLRGIEKILNAEEPVKKAEPAVQSTAATAPAKRIISHIQTIGARDGNDLWPKGAVSSVINKNDFPAIAFQIFINGRIGVNGSVPMDFIVYDEMGNVICHELTDIAVQPEYDRFSKVWILRGTDGSSVSDGMYRVVFRINDSAPVEYKFRVTSSNAPVQQYTPVQPVKKRSKTLYLVLCLFLGMFGVHSFYAGCKKKGVTQLIFTFTGFGAYVTVFWVIFDLLKGIFAGVPVPKPKY